MFGLGRKDKDGKQVRIEHRGEYTRASRRGCVDLRAEKNLGPINATANTSDGIRLFSHVPLKGRLLDERLLVVASQFLSHSSKLAQAASNQFITVYNFLLHQNQRAPTF